MTADSRSTAERTTLTPRMLRWIEAIARFGILTSEQVAKIDGGSRQNVVRGLAQCVDELKVLRRIDNGADALFSGYFDTRPRAYSVTARGLRALHSAHIPLNVTPKKNDVLIAHEIEVAEYIFTLAAASAAAGVRLIDQPEYLSAPSIPLSTRALKHPLRLIGTAEPHEFPHLEGILTKSTDIPAEPDRLCALVRPDNTGITLANEIDRSTEDVTAHRIRRRATYFRKVLGYYAAWNAGAHLKQFGEMARAFRVAVITTCETRIGNMITVQEHIGAPSGLFVYTTPERLKVHGALGPAWITSKSDRVSLFGDETRV
jgi:hypothetical protein